MSSRRAALSAILFLLLLPATAAASPDWVQAVNFPLPSSDVFGTQPKTEDQIAYQNGGIATEAFLQIESLSPIETTLHIGTAGPGGGYSDQLTINSSAGAIPLEPQIAVAPDGAAVVVWTELTGPNLETSPYRYRAAYRPAGSAAWEAPFTIATDSERNKEIFAYVTAAIGSDGTAAAGVQHIASGEKGASRNEPVYRLDVAVHPPAGAWQAPVRLSPSSESGEGLSLGLDGQGNLSAAYMLRFNEGSTSETSDDRYTAIVRRRPGSSGVWGPEEDITGSEVTHSAFALHLGEDEAGDAVLTYQYGELTKTFSVWAVTRQGPNGSWTTPASLVTGSSAPEAAAVAPNGVAYILYSFQGASSAESCEGVLRAPTGGAFTAQRCVSPPNEDTFSGSIAFLGNDAYFAWRGNVPGESSNASVQAARWSDGASLPDVARNLDPSGVNYGAPTIVSDRQGSAVAFYTNGQPGQLRAAAYDAGPPIQLAAGVPASAIAGQPVSFSASFFDLWSGLGSGQPTWSFGDGSALASGAAATHTFSAPGQYTVTLGAADALGNRTSSTFTITVSQAPAGGPPSDTQPPKVTLDLPKCRRKLSAMACKRLRASRRAWQTLTGGVSDPLPSSGIANVEVAIYLTRGKRIEVLSGGRFRRSTRTKARRTFVRASLHGGRWSLHLPALKPGTYTVLVEAIDRAGHVSAVLSKTLQLK